MDYLLYLVNPRKTSDAEDNVKKFILESKGYNETRSVLSVFKGIPVTDKEEKMNLISKPAPLSKNRFKVSALKKFYLLLKRGFSNLVQHKKLFLIFNFQMFMIMAITICVYQRMRRNYDEVDPEKPRNMDIQDRIASFFFVALNFYCCILLNSSFSMEEESQIIYKEISAGQYGYGAYFWSKTLVDLVLLLPPVFAQIFIVVEA